MSRTGKLSAAALLVLGTPWGRKVIQGMSSGVSNLLGYAKAGTDFSRVA